MESQTIPCPFVYAKGRKCTGHVTRVEAYKADLGWTRQPDGTWKFEWDTPRSHYHLFCSEKGNHAGYARQDSDQMKVYVDRMPDGLWKAITAAL